MFCIFLTRFESIVECPLERKIILTNHHYMCYSRAIIPSDNTLHNMWMHHYKKFDFMFIDVTSFRMNTITTSSFLLWIIHDVTNVVVIG
jgi:hypothetical protein